VKDNERRQESQDAVMKIQSLTAANEGERKETSKLCRRKGVNELVAQLVWSSSKDLVVLGKEISRFPSKG
jgi:hypothetical protein